MGEVFNMVYEVVCTIPKGSIATYGQIAHYLGMPKSAKIVGYALHVNPEPGIIPCHRVVNRRGECSGSFAFGGAFVQAELLMAEGVKVVNNKVDLNVYAWKPKGN